NSYPGDDWENYIVTNMAIVKLYNYYKENPDKKVAVRKASAKFEIKLRITGDGRQGLLEDIKNIIGKENIKRIFLNTSDSLFESIIILYINDLSFLNDIFSKLLIIKGIMGAEKIEDL
ncbi:MAG: hypothetical protein QG635_2074, partial [Bacteroidota bacterium]|nr:hypothetical protein [Bacteroidota bacterium]